MRYDPEQPRLPFEGWSCQGRAINSKQLKRQPLQHDQVFIRIPGSTMTTLVAEARQNLGSAMLPRTQSVLAAVPEWWAAKASQAGLSGSWTDVTFALEAQPPGEIPRVEPALEINARTSAEALGENYVASLSGAERSKNGQHYTPASLASRVWEMTREALKMPRGRSQVLEGLVRDPACGAGALLLPALREHLRASQNVDPAMTIRALPSKIHGIDQDPWSAWITNVVLAAEVLRTVAKVPEKLRTPIPATAETGDGLLDREPAWATIMNPPYGRLRLSEGDRAKWEHVLYGHANIYGIFMASGVANTMPKGALTCLVPTSFMAGRYFYKLRGHLADVLPLHAMNFIEGRSGVFTGVLQETCIATFKRGTRRVAVSRSNGDVTPVAVVPVPKTDNPWLMPREPVDALVAAGAAKMPLNLAKAGWHASTGPLVWNRRKKDLCTQAGENHVMILWGADMDGGVIRRNQVRDNMRFLELSVPSDHSVMVLDRPAVLVQRTTSPEQQRRLVAAELTQNDLDRLGGGVVIENHVNILRPTQDSPMLSREALTKILQTKTMDRLIRCISGSVAISSYELGALPLPSAEVLAAWEHLEGAALEKAVRAAYTPGDKR